MIKRALCILLCTALICFTGCGLAQQNERAALKSHLKGIPDYSLDENANASSVRQMAVKAMRDEITVPWFTKTDIIYTKTGPASDKLFRFKTNKIYCGLPYTNSNTGLLHWLQYYDFETGEIKNNYGGNINRTLGNACAVSVMWGWASVTTSTTWHFCSEMVPSNGCLPVGKYKFDQNIVALTELGTDNICKENGKDVMFDSYAAVDAADALVYCPTVDTGNHVVMAIKKPKIVYKSDGSIDGDKSVIYFQDQNIGNFNYSIRYHVLEDGEYHHYSGNRNTPQSFESLYKNGFIPITCAEFTGKKPYEKARVWENGTGEAKTYNDLAARTVSSNYNIIKVSAEIKDKNGDLVVEDNYLIKSDEIKQGKCLYCPLKNLLNLNAVTEKLQKGEEYNVKIDTLVATGETFNVISANLIY